MAMCNVKGVARSDEPAENHHLTAVYLSFAKDFSLLQLIILVSWPTALLFWFGLTTLISVRLTTAGSCF